MGVFLNVLKWSAVVGAAVLVAVALKALLDRKYNPRWRYWLWLILAVALLLSPVRWGELLPDRAGPLVTVEVPELELAVGGGAGLALREPEGAPEREPVNTDRPQEIAGALSTPQAEHASPVRSFSLDKLIPAAWLIGAAAFALWHILGTARFRRKAIRWSRPAPRNTAALFDTVRREMGLDKGPRLLLSAAVSSPMVVGLFAPCLLLPETCYSAEELAFILRHELTHYRRHDLWYKLLILAAGAVHWFNPLIWLMRREAGETLELLCDEAAVAGADDSVRRAYCETLLSSLHRQRGLDRAVLSTHFYGGAWVIKKRLKNLLGNRGRRFGAAALAVVLLLTVLGACAFGMTRSKSDDAKEPEGEALSQAELDMWRERLESLEWNGFVTEMYSDVRRLSLRELLYLGGGIGRDLTADERTAYYNAFGDPGCPTFAIDKADVEAYLEAHAGLTSGDFACGLAEFDVLEGFDAVFLSHGDTNFVSDINVTGGTRDGDTVYLQVDTSGFNGNAGTLTIRDGRVVSYADGLYTAVEDMAWGTVDGIASAVDDSGAGKVMHRTVALYNYRSKGLSDGNKSYLIYGIDYRLCLDRTLDGSIDVDVDGKTVKLTGRGGPWVSEDGMLGSVMVVSVDENGGAALEMYLTGAEAEQWRGDWDGLLRRAAGAEAIFTAERFASEPYSCVQELFILLMDNQYFSVRLHDGQTGLENEMSFTPENGGSVCDVGHLIHQTYSWEAATEEDWNGSDPGSVLTILREDSPAQLMCRQSSDFLAITEDGESWWYCHAGATGDGQPSLYDALLEAAYSAAATPADYVNSIFAAITQDDDFSILVTEGSDSREYSGGGVWNVSSSLTDGQATEVTAADWQAVSDPGTVFEVTDGVRSIRCRTADDLSAVTDRDNTRYFSISNPDGIFNGGGDRLRLMAEEAAEDGVFYGGSADGGLDMDGAARQLAEDIALRMRELPDWVAWKPADFQVSAAEVYDRYYGQPEQFCARIGFYIKLTDDDINSEARGWWETGSGLGDPAEGGQWNGYYGWGRECLVKKKGGGNWILAGMGTGGYTVDLPGWVLSSGVENSLERAALSQLVDMFYLTGGYTHEYLLPNYMANRPAEELAELGGILAQRGAEDVQELYDAMAAYLAEYGGYAGSVLKSVEDLQALLGDGFSRLSLSKKAEGLF